MPSSVQSLTFLKEILIDKTKYFLFTNPKGEKRLVEAEGYVAFRFTPGLQVEAITEKKGCAGEAITEIMHPIYSKGNEYLFTIKRTGTLNINNEKIYFLVISDSLKDEFKITVANITQYKPGTRVKCRLKEQNKGYLKFELV